jgi:SAM-dependent methyltransferase
MRGLFPAVHDAYVRKRRVRQLGQVLAQVIPCGASVLDVGSGDGLLSLYIETLRPDVQIQGIDVLARHDARLPVQLFDGVTIPDSPKSRDVVLFADVLHHTADPMILLREAVRVARHSIIIKDHTKDGVLAGPTLAFMDRVGNAQRGIALPHNYWTRHLWLDAFQILELSVADWRDDLKLYPWPADLIFGRSLHFVTRLVPRDHSR